MHLRQAVIPPFAYKHRVMSGGPSVRTSRLVSSLAPPRSDLADLFCLSAWSSLAMAHGRVTDHSQLECGARQRRSARIESV